MKRVEAIKILCLISFFLFCFCLDFSFSADETKMPAAKTQPENSGTVIRPKEEFNGVGLRDPFRDYFSGPAEPGQGAEEAKAPEVPPPSLTVQGVISGGRINQAIVNNKIVKVGDTIEGAIITNIDKSGVTVFFSNKSFKISSPAAETLQGLKKKPEGGHDEK